MSQTLMLDVLSTSELESGVRLGVLSAVVEGLGVFSARSLGKACFRCIMHAGTHCTSCNMLTLVEYMHVHAPRGDLLGALCSCMRSKRSKSISPKIRRDGEDHQTCTKLSQTKLYHVTTLHEMVVSVCVMFGMSYSHFVFWLTRPREISTIKNEITHDAENISTPAAVL